MKAKPHRTEYLFPDRKPHVPTRITRRAVTSASNIHPLPTLPAQSAEERRLHSDPEYCRLVREVVSGARQWRATSRYDRSDEQRVFNKPLPEMLEKRLPKTPKEFHPKRLNARALAEQEGWEAGTVIVSKRWKAPRTITEVCDMGAWLIDSGAKPKPELVQTFPADAVALVGGDSVS